MYNSTPAMHRTYTLHFHRRVAHSGFVFCFCFVLPVSHYELYHYEPTTSVRVRRVLPGTRTRRCLSSVQRPDTMFRMCGTSVEFSVLATLSSEGTQSSRTGIFEHPLTNALCRSLTYISHAVTIVPSAWERVVVFWCTHSGALWYVSNHRRVVLQEMTDGMTISNLSVLEAFVSPPRRGASESVLYLNDILIRNNRHVHTLCFSTRWVLLVDWVRTHLQFSGDTTQDMFSPLEHMFERMSPVPSGRPRLHCQSSLAFAVLPFFSVRFAQHLWGMRAITFADAVDDVEMCQLLYVPLVCRHNGYTVNVQPNVYVWHALPCLDVTLRKRMASDCIDVAFRDLYVSADAASPPPDCVYTMLCPDQRVVGFVTKCSSDRRSGTAAKSTAGSTKHATGGGYASRVVCATTCDGVRTVPLDIVLRGSTTHSAAGAVRCVYHRSSATFTILKAFGSGYRVYHEIFMQQLKSCLSPVQPWNASWEGHVSPQMMVV